MNFKIVSETLIRRLNKSGIDFAFIGAIAVGMAGYRRFTEDIDFLVLSDDRKKVHKIMTDLDYKITKETEEFALYDSDVKIFGSVDFLFAHRKHTLNMLKRAKLRKFLDGALSAKVVNSEDIIGLKVQAIENNPERAEKDMLDIENIIKINKNTLDLNLIREYFRLFNRESELDKIMEKIKDA